MIAVSFLNNFFFVSDHQIIWHFWAQASQIVYQPVNCGWVQAWAECWKDLGSFNLAWNLRKENIPHVMKDEGVTQEVNESPVSRFPGGRKWTWNSGSQDWESYCPAAPRFSLWGPTSAHLWFHLFLGWLPTTTTQGHLSWMEYTPRRGGSLVHLFSEASSGGCLCQSSQPPRVFVDKFQVWADVSVASAAPWDRGKALL